MRAYVRAVLLLAVVVAAGLGITKAIGKPAPPPSEDFKSVARRAFAAMRDGDWDALAKDAAPKLAFSQYTRAYTQYLSKEQLRELFPDVLFAREEMDSHDVGLYTAAYKLVDTSKPLSGADARTFRTFSKYVRESWTTERGTNEFLQENPGSEVPELTGSAASGTYASNLNWRIELEKNSGRWRVSRLVLMTH